LFEIPKSFPIIDLGKLPKQGSFETDLAYAITRAKIVSGRLMCTVSWHPRPNGVIPEESQFSNADIKKYNPLILCEWYERICKIKRKVVPPIPEITS
jgi:hypothetical protein